MNCPPLNELSDYARGLMAEAESAGIKTHLLTGCGNCAENLHWLGDVVLLAAHDRSFDFPEETIKGLVAWFKSQPAHAPQTLGQTVRKLMANLVFDNLTQQQFAPVRGEAGVSQPPVGRQMLFQAEGYDIDLRFEGAEEKATEDLIGQILPNSEAQSVSAGVTIQLWKDEKERMSAETDNQGLFRFTRIPSGVYDLKIQVAEGEINIVRVSTARAA